MGKELEDKLEVARTRAAKILEKNNLNDWTVEFTRARRELARTRHRANTIFLSKYMVQIVDEEEFDGIVLHEVAHAKVGPGFGHGKEFYAMYNKLDPTGKFSKRGSNIMTNKYTYICDECGITSPGDIKREYKCGLCRKKGKESRLRMEENKLVFKVWASKP